MADPSVQLHIDYPEDGDIPNLRPIELHLVGRHILHSPA
jgi:hypothetical protein